MSQFGTSRFRRHRCPRLIGPLPLAVPLFQSGEFRGVAQAAAETHAAAEQNAET
jgi:hypothetical protein